MNVQYLKDYPDNGVRPGFVFKAGWTTEHDEPLAMSRISAGICKEVPKGTMSRRTGIVTDQCGALEIQQPQMGQNKQTQK